MAEYTWELRGDFGVLMSACGDEITVDGADVLRINSSGYHVRVSPPARKHRVVTLVKDVNGVRKTTSLGRFILNISGKQVVYHINNNPLDNTRQNLRVAATIGMHRRGHACAEGVVSIRSRGGVVMMDESDIGILDTYGITVARRKKDAYLVALAHPYDRKVIGTTLGRVILGATPGQYVDHINHDTLDNRRANLRLCSYEQNCWNTRPTGASGYKGVCKITLKTGKVRWRAQLQAYKVLYRLGVYDSAEEAARAADEGAKKYHGEFAYLNFPATPA